MTSKVKIHISFPDTYSPWPNGTYNMDGRHVTWMNWDDDDDKQPQPVILDCTVGGFPEPAITWFKVGAASDTITLHCQIENNERQSRQV